MNCLEGGFLMRFIKNFIINLAIIGAAILVLYLIYPYWMGRIIEAYGVLLGPAGILAIIVFALPRRRR
jgi:preprotein translocase subunit SecY